MCSLQQCRRELQAALTCTLCYRETAIRLYDPPTPALRSCPGSCRCVGSPALKKVKSDEQCTAHCCGTAEPYRNHLRLFTNFTPSADHRDSAEPGGVA